MTQFVQLPLNRTQTATTTPFTIRFKVQRVSNPKLQRNLHQLISRPIQNRILSRTLNFSISSSKTRIRNFPRRIRKRKCQSSKRTGVQNLRSNPRTRLLTPTIKIVVPFGVRNFCYRHYARSFMLRSRSSIFAITAAAIAFGSCPCAALIVML